MCLNTATYCSGGGPDISFTVGGASPYATKPALAPGSCTAQTTPTAEDADCSGARGKC